MNIKIYEIQSLTELTCVANGAQYGFACNKTVFLFQKHMQSKEENVRTWTAIHYERDRFGLINGLMYLLEKENVEKIEIYFFGSYYPKAGLARFNKNMSFSEISKKVDLFYEPNENVVYR